MIFMEIVCNVATILWNSEFSSENDSVNSKIFFYSSIEIQILKAIATTQYVFNKTIFY